MAAGFTQSVPLTDRATDPKPLSNEMIERDLARFDVPPVLSGGEFDPRFTFERGNGLLLDQCDIVPIAALLVRFPPNERPRFDFAEVSVTPKAAPSDGLNVTTLGHFEFGFRSDKDALDSSCSSHIDTVVIRYKIACVCLGRYVASICGARPQTRIVEITNGKLKNDRSSIPSEADIDGRLL
jgi:hypothetical protein